MALITLAARGAETPSDAVLAALHAVHPGLGLLHHPLDRDRWSVTLRWRENDPRFALVRTGELGDAPWDVIGDLPHGLRLDEVPGYVARHLARCDREDARNAALAAQQQRAAQTDAHLAKPFEAVEEVVRHVGAAAMVTGDATRRTARSTGYGKGTKSAKPAP
jgi:hypothetical protein